MNFRQPYAYDVKEASDATAIPPGGPSLTIQSQSEDADINVLMYRYGVTGKFPENPLVPSYVDYSNIGDFRSALHAIQAASEAFMQYPADFRARFDNDPQNFLLYAENPANIPEMKKLGFFKGGNNVSQGNSGGNSASQGSPSAPQGGDRAAPSDGGAGVSKRPDESGQSNSEAGSASAVRR